MQKITETLARLGTAELTSLIGHDTISILEQMQPGKKITSYKLAEVVVRQFLPDEWLLTQSNRESLIEALSENDATLLCKELNVLPTTDPWTALLRCKFQVGSELTRSLFDFFGCVYPERLENSLPNSCVEVPAQYPLFEHQIIACRKAANLLEHSPTPRVLLHMPTGAGKTRTAMNLIAHFARHRLSKDDLVIWLAHSEELCDQAADEFEDCWRFLGIRSLKLHRCYASHSFELSSISSGIIVGGLKMIFSKSQRNQTEFLDIARRTKLVVLDEAHQAIAPTYQHILDILAADPATAILGLSATPGRSTFDALEDMRLAKFFARQKVTLEVEGFDSPVDYLQKEGYLATVSYERLNYQPSRDFVLTQEENSAIQEGLEFPPSVLKKLGADERRNMIVLNRILKEAEDPASKIIVFACSVDHARLIANMLMLNDVKAASIDSSTRLSNRRMLIQQFRDTDDLQVITNYGVLTTGFDAPRTNTAVIARPTDSVVLFSQMVGRASRGTRAGGNKECKIITIVDELPGFRSVAEAFEYWDDIWE